MAHTYGFNCMDLTPGTICLDSKDDRWVYIGTIPSEPANRGNDYLFHKVPHGFGNDITLDTMRTHTNGREVSSDTRRIVSEA